MGKLCHRRGTRNRQARHNYPNPIDSHQYMPHPGNLRQSGALHIRSSCSLSPCAIALNSKMMFGAHPILADLASAARRWKCAALACASFARWASTSADIRQWRSTIPSHRLRTARAGFCSDIAASSGSVTSRAPSGFEPALAALEIIPVSTCCAFVSSNSDRPG